MSPVITLTTDFGTSDAYVASMKGVILTINPNATIVDVCHSVEPQNILEAGFIISTAYHYFPEGSIHVAVVDPGVGSQRKAIILKTPSAFFVAPDNGILSYIVDDLDAGSAGPSPGYSSDNLEQRKLGAGLEAVAITNADFRQQPVSGTFHGRDIFAPVAAHLSLGLPVQEFGKNQSDLHIFPIPRPCHDADGNLTGRVLHIDSFGNLITNFKHSDLPPGEIVVEIDNRHIRGPSQFYSQGDGLLVLVGSSGYLEISLRNGNAATFLDINTGAEIKLKGG